MARDLCLRCRRPTSVCFCAQLVPQPTRTRVVFLQHPRERKVAIGTCRMAHLSLPNSELHVGVDFSRHARVQELVSLPGTWVLYPSAEATDVRELAELPRALVVVDGTWSTAKKVLQRNEALSRLPRLGLRPERPGNYRIRREPSEHCLATVEAVAAVLGYLESDPARFTSLLRPFDWMVEGQLAHIRSRAGPSRYRVHKPHRGSRRQGTVFTQPGRALVAVYAEANAWPADTFVPGKAELLQVVAQRLGTGERFAALLRPSRPLGPNAHLHLELDRESIEQGEGREAALARLARWLEPADLPCSWGRYPRDLLTAEGVGRSEWLDIKQELTRYLSRHLGGVEAAATALGAQVDAPWGPGRAGRRLAPLAAVLRWLVESAFQSRGSG